MVNSFKIGFTKAHLAVSNRIALRLVFPSLMFSNPFVFIPLNINFKAKTIARLSLVTKALSKDFSKHQ